MKNMEEKFGQTVKTSINNGVHAVLARSYSFYFFGFLLGIIFDFYFPNKPFNESISTPLGMIFIILASYLILWAQKTSRHLKKGDTLNHSNIKRGGCSLIELQLRLLVNGK